MMGGVPRQQSPTIAAPNELWCPMVGCNHYNDGYPITRLPDKAVVLQHLRGESHKCLPPHLVDANVCRRVGLFYCTAGNCPCPESERFFTSETALRRHEQEHHAAPTAHIPSVQDPSTSNSTYNSSNLSRNNFTHYFTPLPVNVSLANAALATTSPDRPPMWPDAFSFISHKYEHDPPSFRSNWYHYLKNGSRKAFNSLMHDIINTIIKSSANPTAYETSDPLTSSAPFWWLLVHLEMLILAPIKIDGLSCQQTISERIRRLRQGRIRELFHHAMQATSWKSTADRPARQENRAAQEAADNDSWRQAVSRVINPDAIASVNDDNFDAVQALYSSPHPSLDLPDPPPRAQHYTLPGNISKSIRRSFKRKGKGSQTDSIDAFIDLAKANDPSTDAALQQIFNLIFQNHIPKDVHRFFTDTYLFLLHKDPADKQKL